MFLRTRAQANCLLIFQLGLLSLRGEGVRTLLNVAPPSRNNIQPSSANSSIQSIPALYLVSFARSANSAARRTAMRSAAVRAPARLPTSRSPNSLRENYLPTTNFGLDPAKVPRLLRNLYLTTRECCACPGATKPVLDLAKMLHLPRNLYLTLRKCSKSCARHTICTSARQSAAPAARS